MNRAIEDVKREVAEDPENWQDKFKAREGVDFWKVGEEPSINDLEDLAKAERERAAFIAALKEPGTSARSRHADSAEDAALQEDAEEAAESEADAEADAEEDAEEAEFGAPLAELLEEELAELPRPEEIEASIASLAAFAEDAVLQRRGGE